RPCPACRPCRELRPAAVDARRGDRCTGLRPSRHMRRAVHHHRRRRPANSGRSCCAWRHDRASDRRLARCHAPVLTALEGRGGAVYDLPRRASSMSISQSEADGRQSSAGVITAAILVIGDEILSGRTKDKNIGYIAEYLTNIGIDLREVRVVPDIEEEIIAALDAVRARYTHVFTTGGIGPTHDDITADCVAKAFGVSIDVDERAVAMLLERIPRADLNEARLRMARIPAGATLIENSVSKAPGFSIGNVHVMAGVPTIMQAMLDALAPRLETGRKMLSR